MYIAIFLIVSYLIGSLPFGLWVGLAFCKTDLRERGSGNIGATNAWRILGWKYGLPIFLLDMAKGLIPVSAAKYCGANLLFAKNYSHELSRMGLAPSDYVTSFKTQADWLVVGCGLAAILGHNFSPFLNFKGGKGVATTCGVAIGMSWKAALAGSAFWGGVLLATGYISLGSLIGTPVGAAGIWYYNGRALPFALFGILATLFVIVKHIPNIKRLANGTELKIGAKKEEETS